ncbi:MAG: deoxyhypusine synthase family protein [Candidatus Thermoplasmatota archaeon]|nr:deoxyhypusine synthase [Euryarchaeota archaeon]MBU4031580.1 deoxyhypusine synthase family protein [Candidatus Thermoplasmatota archaeon]MBU4070754.1 deoxyhypusine synthase family protein [Candidatus Thermoplasmatota archaeon]MBU4144762.1 deoxyhypusine synthase family protein [Candidatus Thermoplasmatota archaeon]MBU4591013.1 deoxyhypusine synthase family protein [Candidatus Thermoplasmatota archaeon]
MNRKDILRTPVKQIDMESIQTVEELVTAFQGSSIQSRNLGICARVWERMLSDKERPTIILGLSGALIAGGQRKVIRDMIKYGLVDAIASTGAVMYQDFYQAMGGQHYVGTPNADDAVLHDMQIDRIYDTYVDEKLFEKTDRYIGKMLEKKLKPGLYSSRQILDFLGSLIDDENSILYTARKYGVPIFSPALNDSSIGIGLTVYYKDHLGKERITLDSIKDNYEILKIIAHSKKTAAIYIGGGTPKNWVNDAVVMANYTFDREIDGHSYAIQVTTDAPHWGGLSGSTLEEAQSWGKVHTEATHRTVNMEASVAMPLLLGYLLQKKVWKGRKRLKFDWDENGLNGITTGKTITV